MHESVKWLADQFWAGKRWVVLETEAGIGGIQACYSDYRDAAAVCRTAAAAGKVLRVRVLGSLLKELNGVGRGIPGKEDIRQVGFAVGRYPIRLFASPANWEEELLFGNYYPVIWSKEMHPLLAVRQYFVAVDREGNLPSRRELYCTGEFPQAIRALKQFVRNRRDQNGTLLLIGQLWEGPFDCHRGEHQHPNNTITFYRTEWEDGRQLDIIQVHDPTQPIIQSLPMFVRFFAQRGELAFYDGKLKRIRPGDEPDFIDLSVFDFRKTVL